MKLLTQEMTWDLSREFLLTFWWGSFGDYVTLVSPLVTGDCFETTWPAKLLLFKRHWMEMYNGSPMSSSWLIDAIFSRRRSFKIYFFGLSDHLLPRVFYLLSSRKILQASFEKVKPSLEWQWKSKAKYWWIWCDVRALTDRQTHTHTHTGPIPYPQPLRREGKIVHKIWKHTRALYLTELHFWAKDGRYHPPTNFMHWVYTILLK